MTLKKFFQVYSGVAILAGAALFAVVRVAYNQITFEAPDVTTIRICHWQLESGFREALQDLIDAYEKEYLERHGEKVRVLQLPVSERGYGQFVNTGLVGGIAPDIIERGFSRVVNDPSYLTRYFLPFGPYIESPNPYNVGTPLEGIPWRQTFSDGLISAYDRELLDYYMIPFSMFTERIYYNKDLYREATGRDDSPTSFLDFINVCNTIRDYAARQQRSLVPLAGSKYQAGVFQRKYTNTFLTDIIRLSDANLDGKCSLFESYQAYRNGVWSFESPALLASWQCTTDIAANFQQGWMAALRDDAVFMFVQGRALMFASGSWDASSLLAQVGDAFEVGVFNFPAPSDHPEYGKFARAMPSEAATGGGIPWGLNRATKHADLCIDFLRFCTTRDHNAQFTSHINWLPIVQGVTLSETLKPFKPRIEGIAGHFDYEISSELRLRAEGGRWQLFSGRMTPLDYAASLAEIYDRTAMEGFRTELEKNRRNMRNMDRIVAGRLLALAAPEASDIAAVERSVMQLLYANQAKTHDLAMDTHFLQTVTQ
ncbi:MAG: extracellular solute-binding protein [Lentisphaerae bacterium]|nr:extracellular solute-binding protein [Lentisphaerota bacterium]